MNYCCWSFCQSCLILPLWKLQYLNVMPPLFLFFSHLVHFIESFYESATLRDENTQYFPEWRTFAAASSIFCRLFVFVRFTLWYNNVSTKYVLDDWSAFCLLDRLRDELWKHDLFKVRFMVCQNFRSTVHKLCIHSIFTICIVLMNSSIKCPVLDDALINKTIWNNNKSLFSTLF